MEKDAGMAAATSAHSYSARISVIRVAGKGSVQAEPDIATIRIGVSTEGATAQEAVSANTAATANVLSGLEAAGIEKRDLKSSNISVYSQYRTEGEDRRQVLYYRVSNNVAVTIRDIARLGDILTRAVAAGSNQINGPSFAVSDPEKYLAGARKKAVENAMNKAREYAAAAGLTLGEVLEIREAGEPAPVHLIGELSRGGGGGVPVEGGEERVEAQVYLMIELKR